MILGLGGNDRLLHPCQKLLRLRQRQPQIRDLAKVVGPADLQHLHTPCPAVGPRFHQLQNPPHPRSPSRQRPDRSYRFRPYPPSLWTLPMNEVTLRAEAAPKQIDGGLEVTIGGSGRTLTAIQRMIPAYAQTINGLNG